MLKYGFFDSVEGDRVYSAEDFSTFYEGLLSDGVIRGVASELKVTPGEGMSVIVGTGKAISGGKWVRNTEPYKLDLAEADSYHDRIDLIVVRTDYTGRTVNLAVKMGTPAQFAQEPVPQNTEHVKELPLACIKVQKNTTTIDANSILERRTYATIQNIKNETVKYVSETAVFAATHTDAIGMLFYQKEGAVVVDTLSVNGSRVVNVAVHAKNVKVPKVGAGYLGIKPLMPSDLGNIPTNIPLSITIRASGGVQIVRKMTDDMGRMFFVLAGTEAAEATFEEMTISYMIQDNPVTKTY